MSLSSDYQKLREKRKKKEKEEIDVLQNDIAPIRTMPSKLDLAPISSRTVSKKDNIYVFPKAASPAKSAEQDEKRTWLTKGAFDDGYNMGDVTKTILGTVGDIGVNLIGSLGDISEGLLNVGATAVGKVAGMFGNDDLQKETEHFIKEDKVWGADDVTDFAEILTGVNVDNSSILGEKSDSVVQSGGQMLTASALQSIGIPWWVTMGTTSFGGKMSESLNEGATYDEALLSSTISASAEILTEKLFGGIKFGGKALDDVLTQKLATSVSNKFVRTALKLGIDVAGEGTEEVLSQGISNFGDWLTYRNDEELKEVFASEESLEEYIESFIGGGLMGGFAGGVKAGASAKKGVDYTSQLTANEEKVVNSIYENRVAEKEADGKKITNKEKNKIYDDVIKDLEKGYISTDTIEEVLGGETYKSYKYTVAEEDALYDRFERLGAKENATLKDQHEYNELAKLVEEYKSKSQREQLKSQLSDEVSNLVKDSRLQESYNEKTKRGQRFEADLSKYDKKYQETIQKAVDSGILNNTNRTHDFVDMVAKISADTGVLFDFANNQKIKDTGFALKDKTVNGYYNNGNVVINIDSAKAVNSVVGHEITHAVEGTELYSALETMIIEYSKSKGDYDARIAEISELYETEDTDVINNELVADLVGDYLFTDEEFIRHLSVNNRNVFQKIYDEIKYLCKVATAGSKEARELERIKKTFAEVYKAKSEQKNNTDTDGGVKYSVKTFADGKKYVKADRQVFSGNDSKKWGRQVTNYINDTIRNGKDVTVYAQDGDALTITRDTAGKAAFRNDVRQKDGTKRPMTDEEYAVKLRAESHIDEISQVSRRGNKTVPDSKNHNFAKDGFNYRSAYFLDNDGKYYRLTLSVGKNGVINTVYNVGKIKEEGKYSLSGSKPVTDKSATMRSSSSIDSISNSTENVNREISESQKKEKQLEIINESNPAPNSYNTWVRNVNDIMTFEEALNDEEYADYDEFNPDFTRAMAEEALGKGKITVYSSYPIKNGAFITPSRMEAESYSGNGQIYQKTVALDDVAWIDITQGQYAKVGKAFEDAYRADNGQKNNTDTDGGVKYSLNKYNEHQIENWKNSKRIVIYNNNEQLRQFIQDSVDRKNVDKKMYFGTIPSDLAKIIQAETGLNVENYNLSLGSFEIRKILKDHGNENKEFQRGQRAVTVDDFAHIVDIVLNPTKIALSEDTYMGKPVITFKGKYNGKMNVVAVVSDKRLDLFVQTVYVNVKKRNLSTPIDEQASINTPEANNGTVSNNSISNSTENVKDVFGYKINQGTEVNENLLEDMSYYHPDAEVDTQGNITVYHRTTKANADKIKQTGVMTAKEDALFFSSKENGYASDYGDTVVKMKIPSTELRLNDVFDGEVHFDLPLKYKNGGYSLDISKYLVDDTKMSLSNANEDIAPVGNNFYGEDVKLQTASVPTEQAIAPEPEQTGEDKIDLSVKEDANKNGQADDIAPVRDDMFPFLDEEDTEVYKNGIMENGKTKSSDAAPIKKFKSTVNMQTEGTQGYASEYIGKILTEEMTGEKRKRMNGWNMFTNHIVDNATPFETLSLKTGNRELDARFNRIRTAEGQAQTFIGNGDEDVGVLSVKEIFAPAEESGLRREFFDYLYQKHNIDRMTLTERFGAGKDKAVYDDDVTADKSREIVQKYELAYPQFKEWAKEVYKYNDYLLDMCEAKGIVSHEQADYLREMYPHYIPIVRNGFSEEFITQNYGKRIGSNSPIKKAVGGNQAIEPLDAVMAQRTINIFKAVAKNSFGVELMNTLGANVDVEDADAADIIEDGIDSYDNLLQIGSNGKNPTLTVLDNGKKVTFDITEQMYDALKPKSDVLAYTNPRASKFNSFRRGLLTEYNPTFLITNAVKDAQDVLMNSQHAAKTYANFPKAIGELAKKGDYFKEYIKNGGDQITYFEKEDSSFVKEKSRIGKVIGFPLEKISQANEFIERIPRLAEYIASRESGASIDVALLDAARVTTNFSAGGDVTKFLNRNGATFLNASVQGFAQQVRNVREAKYNGLKGWVQLATKTAIAGLPALLLNGLLWDDDEDYEQLSDYVKDNYYIVAKFGDGQFVRIPKGRTLSVIQNAFTQVYDSLTGNDELDLNRFVELVINNIAPNNPIDNNIISPIVQAVNNKTWYGDDLVPTRLQDVPEAEQYDESTDLISKWLGEKFNYSPYKINYMLDQYTGGAGDLLLPMLTPQAENGSDSIVGNMIAPLRDKFTTDSVLKNQNISDFYDLSDELKINANSSKATDEDKLKYKYIYSVQSELGDLYKQKRELQNSDLSDSTKYKQVRNLQKQINELAKTAIENYEKVDIGANYATVADRQYRLNSDGEWQKVSDKQLEKQEREMSKQGITEEEYWRNYNAESKTKSEKQSAMHKALGGTDAYETYSMNLNEIQADKDRSGKSISGSRKEKVVDYINSLDIDDGEKYILYKKEYKSDNRYNKQIVNYLNGREDITRAEKIYILESLGFKVDENGNIYGGN